MTDTLFPDLVPLVVPSAEPGEKLSAGRRLTLRQRADIERGRHPLTRSRLSEDPAARCGNCRFREVLGWHNRSYPKCTWDTPAQDAANLENAYYAPPYVSHSAATDVRAWWPGCADHEWGDTRLSRDAARWRP